MPSTEWRENVAADEAQRFAAYADDFAAIQAKKSARFGRGRTLHRKQLLGLAGSMDILDGLPEHARHGLFARPGSYPAWVRLSSGGPDRQPDRRPDIRGFAIKVQGVQGESALGGPAAAQDFLLINHPAFAFPGVDEFIGLVKGVAAGPGALLGYLFSRYGMFGALNQVKKLAGAMGRPFSGFATENFYSAAPIACGPYAVRVRLLAAGGEPLPGATADWASDTARRLAGGPLRFELQLQFFVDEARTPIEDASVDWAEDVAPYVTVGVLNLPSQDPSSAEGRRLGEDIEAAAFDPWCALAAHRPLGEVMRARKVVYYRSQQGRR